jgi:hypothetical protein
MTTLTAPPIPSIVPVVAAPLVPLIGGRACVAVEIAPGKKVAVRDADPLPRYVIAEMVPVGAGNYRLIPRVLNEWMSISQGSLAKLGITLSENTMRRLGRADFFEVRQISPNRYEFNLQSWFAHAEKARDPEFWDAKDGHGKTNRQKYVESL